MKLKNSPIIPEIGEWYVINFKQTADYDIVYNSRLTSLYVTLAPIKSIERQGSDKLVLEFDATKQVELTESFEDTLLKAETLSKAFKRMATAIEKRTGLIFKKDK